MFYSDTARSIKEQIKDVKISIPKVLLILLADIMIATFAVFMGIIGAKVIGYILAVIICVTTIIIPVRSLKNQSTDKTTFNN